MNDICGIILAGGKGTRLLPLTEKTNKHLLPVGGKPMIFHPVEKLCEVGIKDIMVVTGAEHIGAIIETLGSGKKFGCRFTYRIQDEAGGIAEALRLCETFVGDRNCCVLLGDNIFAFDLWKPLNKFIANDEGAVVVLTEVLDPQRYGVANLTGDEIESIQEKPKSPKSNMAVTGIYFYDQNVWDILPRLTPSKRGELEITDVNNTYLRGGLLDYVVMKGDWTDAGTPDSYAKACDMMTVTHEAAH